MFVQSAVAHADVFNFIPSPGSEDPALFTSLGGLPPLDQTIGTIVNYNVVDATTKASVGDFAGVSNQDQDLFGLSTHEILTLGQIPGADVPAHSLFSTSEVFGVQNVYADIIGTGPGGSNSITDTLVTPLGNINVPVSFDAAAALPAAEYTAPANSGFLPGDIFSPGTESYTAISNLPLDQTISGTASYTIESAAGTPTSATFEGVSFHDVSAFSPADQEILVSGTTTAGAPLDGSIFNTVEYGNGFSNVYSDVVGTGGAHTITSTVVTPFGDFSMPSNFDASAAYQPVDFTHPAVGSEGAFTFTPTGAENFTSIATNPMFDQSISGTQVFDASGVYDGTFTGTVTNTVDAVGISDQEILVTNAGTTTLTDGSLYNTLNLGHGFENIYTDIPGSAGGATDTIVTPLGDFNVPVFFDATSALPFAEFIAPGGSAAADLASALNPADFTGLLTDLGSVLDLGSFLAF